MRVFYVSFLLKVLFFFLGQDRQIPTIFCFVQKQKEETLLYDALGVCLCELHYPPQAKECEGGVSLSNASRTSRRASRS